MQSKTPKIALCVHAFKDIDFQVYWNHLLCIAYWTQKYPNMIYCGKKGLDAATARNRLVDRAEENDCTHMFFLDADHLMPLQALDCFMETVGGTSIDNSEAIVSGLVCKKGEGFQQVGFQRIGNNYQPVTLPLDGNVHQVAICAFGCTLISMEHMHKLHKPYFRDICRNTPNGEAYSFRSDIVLCEAFGEIGEKCWIDTRVLVGHHGIDEAIYPQGSEIYKSIEELKRRANKLVEGMGGFYYEW